MGSVSRERSRATNAETKLKEALAVVEKAKRILNGAYARERALPPKPVDDHRSADLLHSIGEAYNVLLKAPLPEPSNTG